MLTCVLLGGLLAATATWRATKIYAATVTMVVSSSEGEDVVSAYQGGLLSEQRVKSYANLVASDRVAASVIDRLRLDDNPSALRGQIEAQAVPETVLLRVSVRDADPQRARSIADAVGAEFSAAVARMETPAENEPPSVLVRVWERAKLPVEPISPRPVRNVVLGVLLGLLISIGAAFVRHRLDTSVVGESDAGKATGLPNLAMIAYDSDAGRRPLISHAHPHSSRAEAFRQLRTNLQFVNVDAGPRSILVSSSVPSEGKTTTICNLAIILAQGGARVCLVEGDLRRPSFGEYLGIESAAGLTSVLIGAADLDDVLQPWGEGRVGDGRVEVLPSGPIPPNPSELLGSRNMADLIDMLRTRFDIVLIDAPPLLPVTDAAVLATRVDGTLLVARVGRTRREQLRRAAEALRAVDGRMIGTVLNMVPIKGPNAHYYGKYDSYAPRGRHARSGGGSGVRIPSATDRGLRPAGNAPVSASDTSSASRPTTASPAAPVPGAPATARPATAAVRETATRAAVEAGTRSGPTGTTKNAAPASQPPAAPAVPRQSTTGGAGTSASRGPAAAPAVSPSPSPSASMRSTSSPAVPLPTSPALPGRASAGAAQDGEKSPAIEIAAQREPDDHTAPLAYGAAERGPDHSTDQ